MLHYVCIFSDVSQIKRHEAQLEYVAHHDALTGLPNRILLTSLLREATERASRTGRLLAVLFIDLDGFKPVNDRCGHRIGDRVLVEMGRRIVNSVRVTDTVTRFGGDEFVTLLPDLSDIADCERIVRRVLKAVAEPVEVEEYRLPLSASIGIALFSADSDDADSLLRRADEAMYVAKHNGRSQYMICSNDLRTIARQVASIETKVVSER